MNGLDASDARGARIEEYIAGATVFGLPMKYINSVFWVFEVIFIYLLFLVVQHKKSRYWVLGFFLFMSLLLWNISNTSKGYIVVVFIYSYLIYLFAGGGKFRVGKAFRLGVYSLLPATLLTFLFMDTGELVFYYPLERFFAGNFLPHYVIFDHFYNAELLLGKSVPGWYTLGMHEQFLLSEWNWRIMHNKMNTVLAYNNPSSFIAEFFANFGYFGFLLWWLPFLYVGCISLLIVRVYPYNFRGVMAVYLTFYFSKYSVKEFLTTIFDYRLVIVVLISGFFFYLVERYFSVRKVR
jgi:hypothetical protein